MSYAGRTVTPPLCKVFSLSYNMNETNKEQKWRMLPLQLCLWFRPVFCCSRPSAESHLPQLSKPNKTNIILQDEQQRRHCRLLPNTTKHGLSRSSLLYSRGSSFTSTSYNTTQHGLRCDRPLSDHELPHHFSSCNGKNTPSFGATASTTPAQCKRAVPAESV
jgi:hypothetical protein